MSTKKLADRLNAFGAEGCVRIAYANSMELLSRAFDEMERALLMLK